MVAYYWQLLNYFYILGNFFSEFKKNQQQKRKQTNKELLIVCVVTMRYVFVLEIYVYATNNKVVNF